MEVKHVTRCFWISELGSSAWSISFTKLDFKTNISILRQGDLDSLPASRCRMSESNTWHIIQSMLEEFVLKSGFGIKGTTVV